MGGPRKILAFDTAMFGCSAALYDAAADNGAVESIAMARGQAEALVPMISRVIAQAKAEFSQIDLICTTSGPGAFTGLRIGLSTARALGLACGVPVIGLTTTEVLAAQFFSGSANVLRPEQTLCVLIETKRQDFYYQFFDHRGAALDESGPGALDGAAIIDMAGPDTVFIGDALARFCEAGGTGRFEQGYELPDPLLMAKLAASGQGVPKPLPLYLRDADVSQAKRVPRRIKDPD